MECCWTLILILVGGALGVYFLAYENLNYFKKRGVPYIRGLPLLGNMGPCLFGKLSFAENVQRLYNVKPNAKYVGLFDFVHPVVMIRDPELIKSVAVKNFDSFRNHRTFMSDSLDPLLAKNVFFLKNQYWRDTRAILSPAFTSSKMKMMFKCMSQCGTDLANQIAAQSVQPIDIELRDAFTRYTNDVILTVAFGINVDSLKERENDFFMLGKEATNLSGLQTAKVFLMKYNPTLAEWLGVRLVPKEAKEFFSCAIKSTIETREKREIIRNDMLQLMMKARNKSEESLLTTENMTAQAFIFFFAGYDTVGVLVSFAAHEVAINAVIQKKLQAEIDAVLAENQGTVTYEALQGMRYMDAVVNETLRLYPSVPAIDRVCSKAFELPPAAPGLKSFTVKAGTYIWLACYGVHRDPKYFPDPEKFCPDRFYGNDTKNSTESAFIPFGIGPRSCIANRFALLKIKIALFHLFAKCNLSPCAKTQIPIKLDRKNFSVTSENNFWITVKQRVEEIDGERAELYSREKNG